MKIAIFAYETRNLNTFPSIVNAIRLLSRNGHSIDVFLPSSMATEITVDNCHIFIVSDSDQYEFVSSAVRLVNNIGNSYDYFFAYYIEGLIVSEILSNQKHFSAPVVYFSMELIYKDYPYRLIDYLLNPNKLLSGNTRSFIQSIKQNTPPCTVILQLLGATLKQIAYTLLALRSWSRLICSENNNVLFSVVSDYMRAEVLKEEFPFVDKIVYAPEAGYIGYNSEKSDYAARIFGIPPGKKILLYTGGFEKGFDLSLLNMSKNLGDDYILFCNIYSRDGYVQEIIPEYSKEIKDGRLFFQTSNLGEKDYDELVRSAHIGVVWYPPQSPDNPNMYYLGFSSGKLNKFLSCGKPVVCSDGIYGYRELIEGNGLGLVCTHADELPSDVSKIENNYQLITQNIREFYLEHIEFEKCFKGVIDGIRMSSD